MAEKKTMSRPYAKALFDLAMQENTLDSWSKFLNKLTFVVKDPKIKKAQFLKLYNKAWWQQFLVDLLEPSLQEKNFIQLLLEYKRLDLIPAIQTLFMSMRNQVENTIPVELQTSQMLSTNEREEMQLFLKNQFNKKIALTEKHDPALLGGFIARAGDVVFNGSLKGNLNALKALMMGGN